LIIIAIILAGILIVCLVSFDSLHKQIEHAYNEFFDSRQSLQFIVGKLIDIAENIESIHSAIADIKFQQENLEKHDLNKAMKTLDNIEDSVTELKYIHDTLSSLESSLEIITSHPAFTKHDDDSL
jgi:hypothetical protein